MKTRFFLASLCLLAFLLHSVSYDERRTALFRWQRQLNLDRLLKDEVKTHCAQLIPTEPSSIAKIFVEEIQPNPSLSADRCLLHIASSHSHRFYLQNFWNFSVRIESPHFRTEKTYSLFFPKPLALLPLLAFFLAIALRVASFSLGWATVLYALLVCGGNVILGHKLAWQSTVYALLADRTPLTVTAVVFWISCISQFRLPLGHSKPFLSRWLSTWVGLWSPLFFTACAHLFYPFRNRRVGLLRLLNAQTAIVCLSAYFFVFDSPNVWNSLVSGWALPRYFTFATLLFLFLKSPFKGSAQFFFGKSKPILSAFICVAAAELAALVFSGVNETSRLNRLALLLPLSLIPWLKQIDLRASLKKCLPAAGVLMLASFAVDFTARSGALDLALTLSDPRFHPLGFVYFTFLAGATLGLLTGSFSSSFFTLFLLLIRAEAPLVRAALIDGILLGCLLSPFSPLNLLAMVTLKIELGELLRRRLIQLALPIAIGSLVYTISALNSIAILQPVTFIFLCLLGIALEFRSDPKFLPRFLLRSERT